MRKIKTISVLGLLLLISLAARPSNQSGGPTVFNVRDFGASGRQADFAGEALQKAVDACAAAGGGMVYLPPGDYTSGMIRLCSHVRFFIEAGATLLASRDKKDYDKEALSTARTLTT
jgi:polygalacturonase